MIVAIDGPAGTGKSTICQRVAREVGLFYLNSGNFYRGISLAALDRGVTPSQTARLIELAHTTTTTIDGTRYLLDGVDREDELHSAYVDTIVAQVSSVPEVRTAVNEQLRAIARHRDVIMEGRDITTVVFPDAEVKIYLDASPEVRAYRRAAQQSEVSYEEVLTRIKHRDEIDRTKAVGRLRQSADSVLIDTSDLTIDQVCERVIATIHDKNQHGRSS